VTNIAKYLQQFASLKRATGPVWSEATRKRAPHKPILLLAVIDLTARGGITSPFIDVSGDLVELNELFNLYWRRVVPLGQTSSIAFPFSRLDREPFWHLVSREGQAVTSSRINNTSSVSYLRRYALGARLDEELFQIIQTEEGRAALREVLLRSCFSPAAGAALAEQAAINDQAYHYSLDLLAQAHQHQPQVAEALAVEAYKPPARDQGFRRVVVKAYEHRCALCGVRIITPEGHTVVDAAHIIPWSKSGNDDIRNGMALCKLCHWAFDHGMMGVADTYEIIIPGRVATAPNAPGFLTALAGRPIIPPADPALRPAPQNLAVHRRDWRL
jgi:putative restriction endonuclease